VVIVVKRLRFWITQPSVC